MDRRGRTWSRDRFFDGGYEPGRYTAIIRDSDDSALFQKRRWWRGGETFLSPGYRMPVPCGRYALGLHFSRARPAAREGEEGAFDVACEGEDVLQGYNPGAGAIGVLEERRFDVEVADGCLDIVLRFPWEGFVSAIELRRLP